MSYIKTKLYHFCFFPAAVLFPFSAIGQEAAVPRVDSIYTFLKKSVDDEKVAGGAVLVWQKGGIVFQTGFGFADRKSRTPFEADTPAIIASISKPMLGTALFRLMDIGKLDVTKPVSEYLPEFSECRLESGEPLNRAPTVVELLSHTAGLRGDYDENGRIWFQQWTRNQKLEYVVGKVASDIPFKRQPSVKNAYSGIGTEIAARVGEVVSDLPRNEMLRRHFCQPLGMRDTFYRDAAALKMSGKTMPTRYDINEETGRLTVARKRFLPDANRYSSSGGTIISSAPDMLRWLLMIRNGGRHEGEVYLSPENYTQMMAQGGKVGNNAAGGFFIRKRDENGTPLLYGHTGSSGTNCWWDVRNDIIGIMLTQTSSSDIRAFRIELQDRITKTFAVE